MRPCKLCDEEIELGTKAASIVGGMFPREEPDFFMTDEQVLNESYVHYDCLMEVLANRVLKQEQGGA